jgi:hypothetical protein
MSMFSSFFKPGRAYAKAGDQFQNYYNQSQDFLRPYHQNAQEAYGHLSGAMQNLLNPEQLHSQWAQGYEMSPYARIQQDMARENGLSAASSMGLMGSSAALQALQNGTSQIGAADRDNYLNNLMQKYLSGAQLAQGIYGTGASAAGQLGQNAMNMGQNAAQMTYGQNAAGGDLFGKLLGSAIGMAGSALGGPIGGALANRFIGPWGSTGGQ